MFALAMTVHEHEALLPDHWSPTLSGRDYVRGESASLTYVT
jgi:hypothetical protein